jgi:hypothetical protein
MITAAGRGILTIETFLYPEFSGEEKNVLHSFSCRMSVRLLPETQQEPTKDTGSTLHGKTREKPGCTAGGSQRRAVVRVPGMTHRQCPAADDTTESLLPGAWQNDPAL